MDDKDLTKVLQMIDIVFMTMCMRKRGEERGGNTLVENQIYPVTIESYVTLPPCIISFDLNAQCNTMRSQSKSFIYIYYESEAWNLF